MPNSSLRPKQGKQLNMGATAKNLVFDWNCTLLDDIGALHQCTNQLLEGVSHPPVSLEFFQNHYDIPFRRLYNNLGLTDDQTRQLIEANNTQFHDLYESLARQTELRDGAVWVLQQAKAHNVATYILSNHLVDPIRMQLKRLGIENFFEEVLAYGDRAAQQARHMTKGEQLRQFMEGQDINGGNTIIIGDSVEEIEIAEEQGLISVAITGGCVSEERLREANPDYVIHSLHELKPIMQERGFIQ